MLLPDTIANYLRLCGRPHKISVMLSWCMERLI